MNKTIMLTALLGILILISTTAESSTRSQTSSLVAVAHSQPSLTTPVDINTADEQILSTLKGVGKKKAQAVIEYRKTHGRYKSLNDLTQVKGWGKKSLQRIMDNNPNRLRVG